MISFQTLAVSRIDTKKRKNSQFLEKIVRVPETFVVGFGTRNPFCER